METSDESLVKITHYINPHMFWFKYESSFFTDEEFFELCKKIESYYYQQEKQTRQRAYKPQIGEIVGIYNFSWNRWIRAEVDYIFEFSQNYPSKYIVWAIDYGIPLQVEHRFIRKLPKDLADIEINAVYFGGIADIVPSEKEYDFLTSSTKTVKCKKWSPYSVKIIDDLINDAAYIRFIKKKCNPDNGQIFGDLEIVTHTNQIIKPEIGLLQSDHAMSVKDNYDFFKTLKCIGTNQLPRWQTDDGRPHVYKPDTNNLLTIEKTQNIFKITNKHLQNRVPEDYCVSDKKEYEREIVEKINDWQQRNQKSYTDGVLPLLNPCVENHTETADVGQCGVNKESNEIETNKSDKNVSVNENLNEVNNFVEKKSNHSVVSSEIGVVKDGEEICALKVGGATRLSRMDICKNNAPPQPCENMKIKSELNSFYEQNNSPLLSSQQKNENFDNNSEKSLNQMVSGIGNEKLAIKHKLNVLKNKRKLTLQKLFKQNQLENVGKNSSRESKKINENEERFIKRINCESGKENLEDNKLTYKNLEANTTNTNSNMKNSSLTQQIVTANKRATENVIPAGFDLNNLQQKKAPTKDKMNVMNNNEKSYLEKLRLEVGMNESLEDKSIGKVRQFISDVAKNQQQQNQRSKKSIKDCGELW